MMFATGAPFKRHGFAHWKLAQRRDADDGAAERRCGDAQSTS